MATKEGKVKINKFDRNEFGFWKVLLEDYHYKLNLYLPLYWEKLESMKQAHRDVLDR